MIIYAEEGNLYVYADGTLILMSGSGRLINITQIPHSYKRVLYQLTIIGEGLS